MSLLEIILPFVVSFLGVVSSFIVQSRTRRKEKIEAEMLLIDKAMNVNIENFEGLQSLFNIMKEQKDASDRLIDKYRMRIEELEKALEYYKELSFDLEQRLKREDK